MALHEQSLEEGAESVRGGEVSPESSVRLTIVLSSTSLKCLSRKFNQNTGIPGTREVKPCNLPLKESAMTSETHWSKPALPPHPTSALKKKKNLPCPLHPYPLQPCSFRRDLPLPQILIFFLMTRCLGTGFNSVITKR